MAINKVEIPLFNQSVGSVSDAVTNANKAKAETKSETESTATEGEVKEARVFKNIDMVNLFDIAQNLCSDNSSHIFNSNRVYVELAESSDLSSVYIYIEDLESVLTPTLVFSATISKVQGRKIKIHSYRPGKWVEYLVDTVYSAEQARRNSPVDDDAIDYSVPSST